MWMVIAEDENGCLWDDPIIADTREEAMRLGREAWPGLPAGFVRGLFRCRFVEEVPTLPEPNKD